MILHDINGAFVRASWGAMPEGQTETVHAIEVTYDDGSTQVWSAQAEPMSDELWLKWTRTWLHRSIEGKRTIAAQRVAREVTISATPWEAKS